MAEVLGVASGVAGLLSLTIEVIKITSTYINGVHGASTTMRRLLSELESMEDVLVKIDTLSKTMDGVQVFGEGDRSCLLSVRDGKHYLGLLIDVRNGLDAKATAGGFRKKLKAMTWPFSEEKTVSLIEALHRHLEICQTALSIDNLYDCFPKPTFFLSR